MNFLSEPCWHQPASLFLPCQHHSLTGSGYILPQPGPLFPSQCCNRPACPSSCHQALSFFTPVIDMAWCSALANALWPCSQHLSVLATCPSCDCAVGCIGWPALGRQPCSCCLPMLSLLLHSLADFLLKNWILIHMMNVPLRPQIRHWSLSWFPIHPGGSQVSPYLLLALHRRVAAEFSSTSLVLSFLNPTWKQSNRSYVPCESRYLFQVLFEQFCLEESKNK